MEAEQQGKRCIINKHPFDIEAYVWACFIAHNKHCPNQDARMNAGSRFFPTFSLDQTTITNHSHPAYLLPRLHLTHTPGCPMHHTFNTSFTCFPSFFRFTPHSSPC